jgi:SAM-dependent methyltransferase
MPVLSLGDQYISNFVDGLTDSAIVLKAPLELVLCDARAGGCSLLQLRHTVPADIMFRRYWYRSGVNKTMTVALEDIATKAEQTIELSRGDIIVDIGCNDGTLLRSYRTLGLVLVGYEPAANLIPYAEVGTSHIINDYFNADAYRERFSDSKAKVITSIAMFYDLEDPNRFIQDIAACLDKDGLWIIQMSYLPSMLSQNAFDNICHEHLEYYSMKSLRHLLQRHGFDVFDVELNDVNGGSFRVYVKHVDCSSLGNDPDSRKRLAAVEEAETQMKLTEIPTYQEFAKRVQSLRDTLYQFVKAEHDKGKKIYVYGASTKGNTLLQYCGLDRHLIGAAAERNPDKWGKMTVGTMIPIVSEQQARMERPDYFLVLPWHFVKEFVEREQAFLKSGGKFIVPLPDFKLI